LRWKKESNDRRERVFSEYYNTIGLLKVSFKRLAAPAAWHSCPQTKKPKDHCIEEA
jgi:hypothetical protein